MNPNSLSTGAPLLSAAVLSLAPVWAIHSAAARGSSEDVRVGDRAIRVDWFEPDNAAGARCVLLFHGIGGLLGDGALMRRAARALAARGLRAGVVHYFNATGTLFATPGNVREHAPEWRGAVAGIARHYAAARGRPVGVFGYSLGGFLAVGAAMDEPGVGAVVVMSGGVLEEHEARVPDHLPPLLVLHGGRDSRVSPERAEALARLGRRAGARVESVMYPAEGHAFGTRAERDALDRAAAFFQARLEAGARR